MAEKYFEVQLKKSGVGRPDSQRRTLAGLGLTRFGKTIYLKDTPAVRGMLYKVVHLVDVKPHEGEPVRPSNRSQSRQAGA